jgi:hypothetical protein
MVIVTQNQYILASKIHHITLDEDSDYQDLWVGSRKRTTIDKFYRITVVYAADSSHQSNGNFKSSDDYRECVVNISSKEHAYKVFKNLIQQIREQMPDQLFLDKALEKLLSEPVPETLLTEGGVEDDGSTEKVRRSRKEKKRNKKVFRRSKTRY